MRGEGVQSVREGRECAVGEGGEIINVQSVREARGCAVRDGE